jgi:hypothetical protein
MMCVARLGLETYSGNITGEVLGLGLLSVPVSFLSALLARRFPPPVSDLAMRRVAFVLLSLLGLALVLGAH